jgi:hypothetical protein
VLRRRARAALTPSPLRGEGWGERRVLAGARLSITNVRSSLTVIPANAGQARSAQNARRAAAPQGRAQRVIQRLFALALPNTQRHWIPAFAGMTSLEGHREGMTSVECRRDEMTGVESHREGMTSGKGRMLARARLSLTNEQVSLTVIPAKAGIQRLFAFALPNTQRHWIPAFAGMTNRECRREGMTSVECRRDEMTSVEGHREGMMSGAGRAVAKAVISPFHPFPRAPAPLLAPQSQRHPWRLPACPGGERRSRA